MLVIGSSALKYYFNDFNREPKDLDLVTQEKVYSSFDLRVEYHKNPILESLYSENNELVYIKPNDLYTLKVSHVIGWDIQWEKHMYDIQFLKSKGCVLNKELFYELYNYWNNFHGKNKRSDLEMTSDEFFNNDVNCPYSHDWLHTLIKDTPTFNYVLKDDCEVDVDENKFNALSFEEKCDLVYEEIYVMGYERYINLDYRHIYSKMLKKFILNHAPIWEGIFIIENFKKLHKPKIDFIKLLNEKIENNDNRVFK